MGLWGIAALPAASVWAGLRDVSVTAEALRPYLPVAGRAVVCLYEGKVAPGAWISRREVGGRCAELVVVSFACVLALEGRRASF